MTDLKYKKISSIEQYNEYCNTHEHLVEINYHQNIDEIELLEVLIEEYDNRIQAKTYKELNPVELLQSLLKDANLSQSALAREIKISKQLLSDILHYRRSISKEVVIKLADFFAMQQEAFNRTYPLQQTKQIGSS